MRPPPFRACALALCQLSLAASTAVLAQTNPAPTRATAAAPAPAAAAQVANTPYAIGAQRNGIAKCIGRINQVTGFITNNTANSGIVLNSPTAEANQRLAATVIETESNGATSLASASFSPGTAATECSATYDLVTYWPASCAQVASANFTAYKPTNPLLKNVSTLTLAGAPMVRVFLMPAGVGCVSIKKEMVF